MTTTRVKWDVGRAVAILALAAVPGFASPIFVNNFSFETLPAGTGLPNSCGTGCSFSVGTIPGWTASASAVVGQFQPGTQAGNTSTFNSLSDGITSAFSNTAGSSISQVVVPSINIGSIYTLQVDLGFRKDLAFAGSAALLVNGNTYVATGVVPTRGTFGTFTATYTGLLSDAGKPLTIELLSSGLEGNFDNVRLTETLSPEPTPFFLMGSALLFLQVLRRRRSPKMGA